MVGGLGRFTVGFEFGLIIEIFDGCWETSSGEDMIAYIHLVF